MPTLATTMAMTTTLMKTCRSRFWIFRGVLASCSRELHDSPKQAWNRRWKQEPLSALGAAQHSSRTWTILRRRKKNPPMTHERNWIQQYERGHSGHGRKTKMKTLNNEHEFMMIMTSTTGIGKTSDGQKEHATSTAQAFCSSVCIDVPVHTIRRPTHAIHVGAERQQFMSSTRNTTTRSCSCASYRVSVGRKLAYQQPSMTSRVHAGLSSVNVTS